jgi:hypothetical protein
MGSWPNTKPATGRSKLPETETPIPSRSEIQRQRLAFARSTEGRFGPVMRKAMDQFHRMRTEGVSREDAIRGIDAELRDSWPFPPTKFPACSGCDGTGWRITTCTHQARCGRERPCSLQTPDFEHDYAVECECTAGERFRKQRFDNPEEHLAAVGRRQKAKPRGFSRL